MKSRIYELTFGFFTGTEREYYEKLRIKSIVKNGAIKEELMAVAWHPDRMKDWCLDNEEKLEIDTLF